MTQFSAAFHALKKAAQRGRLWFTGCSGVVKIFLRTGITGCRPARVAMFRRAHRSDLSAGPGAGLVISPAWRAAGGGARHVMPGPACRDGSNGSAANII
jgi:hypothetical protein